MAQGTAVKVLDRPEPSALGEMVHAELSNQIATAKAYPRDEDKALNMLATLACRSDAVAESCMYTLKRRDKDGSTNFITGPSVRFAELLNYCWGNMRAGARIIDEGPKALTAQGVAYDLQRNTGLMLEVRRGIVTSSGGRFGSDMINVTANAACSIALRNVIFDCIPQVLWWDVYEQVKIKAVGAAQIPERIQKAVKFFIAKGAKQEDILASLAVKAIDEMGREHLEIFLGLQTAMKEGTVTADKIFTPEGAEQRKRLSLTDEDDPADPATRVTPIDGLLDKGVTDAADKKKGGASAKKAAPKSKGDEAPEKADTPEANAPDVAAGSAETAKDEGDNDPEKEDADLVAAIEAKLDPAKALSTRKAVNEHRGALARIAELGSDEFKSRAAKILTDWPAK